MAIFSGWASTRGGVKAPTSALSAAKRFSEQMATGWSSSARRHLASHGCGQTRPNTPGRGSRAMMSFRASSYLPALDELHVALDVDLRRAGEGAGGPVQLHDAEGRRDRLGIEAVGRLPVGQPLVELIRHGHRADIGAFAAAGALGRVHITRFFAQGDLEVARLTAHLLDFGEGVDLDVEMPPALHQLGGDDAHGAVVGGKGLVQLRHDAADGGLGFHQMHVESGVGQVQGGLDAGHAAADYHDGAGLAAPG